MELREWIMGNVDYFKGTRIWTQGNNDHYLYYVDNGDYSYDHFVSRGYEKGLWSCSTYWAGDEHYLLWDELGCYTVVLSSDCMVYVRKGIFEKKVWGSVNWREILEGEFGDLFNCGGCKCFNDLLVSGWCNGKVEGVFIKEGFIWN